MSQVQFHPLDVCSIQDEDNGMDIKGTYRYHLRRSPATGEGLMLEKPNFSRPRPGYTPLSMRRESHEEAVPQSMPMRRARNEPMGKFLQSSLPLPSEKFARPGDDEVGRGRVEYSIKLLSGGAYYTGYTLERCAILVPRNGFVNVDP